MMTKKEKFNLSGLLVCWGFMGILRLAYGSDANIVPEGIKIFNAIMFFLAMYFAVRLFIPIVKWLKE